MIIAAALDEDVDAALTSREPRRKLRLEAPGAIASGKTTRVRVHNISPTGLLIESGTPLAPDERIEIELPHAGPTWAKVIWTSDNFFGCQFDAPLSAAALSAAQLQALPERPETIAPVQALPGESFGLRLRRLRTERKLTLSQIAGRLGVSKPTVWAWEQGKARPADGRIEALAQALGVPPGQLQPGGDNAALAELLARSREQIARETGTTPDKVRIMIEL